MFVAFALVWAVKLAAFCSALRMPQRKTRSTTSKRLIKLDFRDSEISTFSVCDLYLVDMKDLKCSADVAMQSFLKPTFMQNGNIFANAYTYIEMLDCWLGNYFGFWYSGGKRLQLRRDTEGKEQMGNSTKISAALLTISHDSIIIAAVLKQDIASISAMSNGSSTVTATKTPDGLTIIGLAELGLEIPNGHFPPGFELFQKNYRHNLEDLEPYLSNVCVLPAYRGLGIGNYMCSVCEQIASKIWKKKDIYLHVEESSIGARTFYERMGYCEKHLLTVREKRAMNMDKILYYSKPLNSALAHLST